MIRTINSDNLIIDYNTCSLVQKGFIEELLVVGRATEDKELINIPLDILYNYKTDSSDFYDDKMQEQDWQYAFNLLELPPVYEHRIRFRYSGGIGQSQFLPETFVNGKRVIGNGPLLENQKDGFILGSLSPEMYEYFLLSKKLNSDSTQIRLNIHRKLLARAKKLQKLNIFEIDRTSDTREFHEITDSIRVDLRINDSEKTVSLVPLITDITINKKLQENWEKALSEKNQSDESVLLPTINNMSIKEYVLLESKQNEQINIIKDISDHGTENPEKLRQFLQNPDLFIDPTIIDTDYLSERIEGYGIFKKFSLTGCKQVDIDWWGNMDVYIPEIDTTIQISKQTIDHLEKIVEEAEAQNKTTVTYNNKEIKTKTLREEINLYQNYQLSGEIVNSEKPEENVYLAKSNLDILEYIESTGKIVEFTFHSLISESFFSLKQHQKEGIAWLQNLFTKEIKGGLLADDMGLGKTLQVLYFLEWEQENRIKKNEKDLNVCLIVPLSLINNWKSEYENFFPHGNLLFKDGTLNEYLEFQNYKKQNYGTIQLVTYQSLQRKQVEYAQIKWDILIADEIQYSKNPGTRTTNALKTQQAIFKLAMTGTPVENNYKELWNIIDWVSPGLLGSLSSFNKKYLISKNSSDEEINQMAKEIRREIGDHMILRTKEQVLKGELPEKFIYTDTVPGSPEIKLNNLMPHEQLFCYNKIRSEARNNLGKGKSLGYIQRMKIISEHPRFSESKGFFEKIEMSSNIMQESGKWIAVEQILNKISNLHEKVLIFTEFRFTQHLLSGWIGQEYNIRVPIINGLSPVQDRRKTTYSRNDDSEMYSLSRLATVEKFNKQQGFAVLVLSPIAAGVGLNITGANHVVHFSRHWNPAKENQATDRAYRIGQTKDVHVYYPKAIAKDFNTFDVNVDRIIDSKRKLSDEALFPSNFEGRMVNIEEMFF